MVNRTPRGLAMQAVSIFAGILCAISVGGTPAHASSFKNGNDLLAQCDNSLESAWGVCLGYIVGVADAMDGNSLNGYAACIPSQATQGQVHDVVLRWMGQHPELRHFAAAGLVAHSLQDAFPCGRR